MDDLSRRYGDKVQFLAVYVREAHPIDGWRMVSNDRVGVAEAQPKTKKERIEVATRCGGYLEIGMPLLVDEMDDRVGKAYSGMPDRLYVIDKQGDVVFKSGRGPFFFNPAEMEQSLAMLLLDETGRQHAPAPDPARVTLLENAHAWNHLPLKVDRYRTGLPLLPAWARVLARTLPRTTAAMLDLDYKHRARSPLDPILRGKVRWIAARSNHSAYAEAVAEADLRRAGLTDAGMQSLRGDHSDLPALERDTLEFARKMTENAAEVTDSEVARLSSAYGEEKLTALVLLLAYSNFQDRLLLALGIDVEPGGPLPPLEVVFDPEAKPAAPDRLPPPGDSPPAPPERIDDREWLAFDFDALQKNVEAQKARAGRIRVPTWDEVKNRYPPGARVPVNPLRIQWSLVCMGYQPELAAAWSACTRSFAEEARQDRVFEESLFWVVTRTIHCFY